MPWRNGCGSTMELLIAPEGASLERFDVRLSIAQLDAPAPFSAFPGIERWLLMLEGSVRLEIGDAPGLRLGPEQEAIEFAGEQRVSATPLETPAKDLNLMIRRARYRGLLRRLNIAAGAAWQPSATVSALLCRRGSLAIDVAEKGADADEGPWRLDHDDVLLVEGPRRGALLLKARPDTQLYLAEVFER